MKFLNKKIHRKKARSSNAILLEKIIVFLSYTLAILLIPIGFFDYGRKKRKYKEKNRRRAQNSSPTSITHIRTTKSESKIDKNMQRTSEKASSSSPDIAEETPSPVADFSRDEPKISEEAISAGSGSLEERADLVEKAADAKILKSTPRYEKDKYIRKIMRFSLDETDSEAAAKLHTGIYFDITAVRLGKDELVGFTYLGERIGYASKEDESVLLTCLSLGEKLYGIITDIDIASGIVEYEVWIDKKR